MKKHTQKFLKMLLPETLTDFKKTKIKYHREEGQTYKGGQYLPKLMRKQHGLIRAGKGGLFLMYIGNFKNPQMMYYKKTTLSTTHAISARRPINKSRVFWEIWLGRCSRYENDWHHFWLPMNDFNDTLVKHFLMCPQRLTKMLEASKCKFRVAMYKKMIHGIFMQLYERAAANPAEHRFYGNNIWEAPHTGYFLDIEKEANSFKGRITTPFKNVENTLFNIDCRILKIDRGDSKEGMQLFQKSMTDAEKQHFNFKDVAEQTAINYRFKVPDIPLTKEIFKMLKMTNGDMSNQFNNWGCWEIRNLGIRILAFLNVITNNRRSARPIVNKMDSKSWFDSKDWVRTI